MARKHLAVFLRGFAKKILEEEKTVELRFSQNQILPYKAITKDDIIFLKNSGGKIIGKVTVDNVLYYQNLSKGQIFKIKQEYGQAACMDDNFWAKKINSRFVSIILLKNPVKFLAPLLFKKHDRRPWVILEDE
jgi:predicted transcriptional regulator